MTEQSIDDRYPEAWRPRGAPPFEEPEPEPQVEPATRKRYPGT